MNKLRGRLSLIIGGALFGAGIAGVLLEHFNPFDGITLFLSVVIILDGWLQLDRREKQMAQEVKGITNGGTGTANP